MDNSVQVLIGMAVLAMLASAFVAVYRWRQRQRVRQVTVWIGNYLSTRYGKPPGGLTVNCSDDANWPVLASFDDPHNGARRSAQFACPGPQSTFALVSEKQEQR